MNDNYEIALRNEVGDLPLWRESGTYAVLASALAKHQVSEEIFAQLVSAYRSHAHKQRVRGLTADFDDIFQSVSEDR